MFRASIFVTILFLSWSISTNALADAILFLGGGSDPVSGDDAGVFDHLEALGHDITYSSGDEASPGDATGQDAIVISSTLNSSTVRGKFQDLAVPILNWEEALTRWEHDDPDGNFRTTELSRNGGGQGTLLIKIADAAVGHPLTGGLPAGEHEIFEDPSGTPVYYGEHAPGLIRIAELDPELIETVDLMGQVDDNFEASFWLDENGQGQVGPPFVIVALDAGSELGPAGEGLGVAPARRVLFPIEDSGFLNLNDNGIQLFDCALEWVLGRNCLGPDVLGDFDADGQLTNADVDLLGSEIASGANTPSFDLNADGAVDSGDLTVWVKDLKNSWIGDANLNGEFNSGDLVTVFQAGLFETGQPATWSAGDWSGDGVFSSGDFVAAFQDGGFEQGPRPAAVVPEPSSFVLGLMTVFVFLRIRSTCH